MSAICRCTGALPCGPTFTGRPDSDSLLPAGTEWVTGASDGSLATWSQTKKRPTSVLRRAHGYPNPGLGPVNGQVANSLNGQAAAAEESSPSPTAADAEPVGAGSVGGDAAAWIGAVGVCKGTDLVVGPCYSEICGNGHWSEYVSSWSITCGACAAAAAVVYP